MGRLKIKWGSHPLNKKFISWIQSNEDKALHYKITNALEEGDTPLKFYNELISHFKTLLSKPDKMQQDRRMFNQSRFDQECVQTKQKLIDRTRVLQKNPNSN